MEKTITVEIKSNYGNKAIYVISEHKEAIKVLTKTETLTNNHIEALKSLGFEFQVKQALLTV